MIELIDQTLRGLLLKELEKDLAPLITSEDQIVFGPPSATSESTADRPVIHLHLHDIRENLTLRDNSLTVSRKPGDLEAAIRRAGIKLDLAYVISCSAGDDALREHSLLASVLGACVRRGLLHSDDLPAPLREAGANSLHLAVAQPDHPANHDLRGLWTALGGKPRPLIGLIVTTNFNPYETRLVKLVREAMVGVGLIGDGNRPQDVLRRRVSVAGIVLAGEKPISGARLWIEEHRAEAFSDAEGLFHLDYLPPGACILRVEKPGYRSRSVEAVAPPVGRPDLLEPIVAKLEKDEPTDDPVSAGEWSDQRMRLSGRLEFEDGRPCRHLVVRVGTLSSITDANGNYVLEGVAPGVSELIVEPHRQDPVAVPAGGLARLKDSQPRNKKKV